MRKKENSKNDSKNEKSSKLDLTKYKDYQKVSATNNKFTYYIPKDWTKTSGDNYSAPLNSKTAGNNVNVYFSEGEIPSKIDQDTCEELGNEISKSFGNLFESSKNTETKYKKVNDKDACFFRWKNTMSSIDLNQEQLIIIDDNKKQYTITLTQLASVYDKEMSELIFNSIKFV